VVGALERHFDEVRENMARRWPDDDWTAAVAPPGATAQPAAVAQPLAADGARP
jgi:hypothetical protein